jgi:hypothetical protein
MKCQELIGKKVGGGQPKQDSPSRATLGSLPEPCRAVMIASAEFHSICS